MAGGQGTNSAANQHGALDSERQRRQSNRYPIDFVKSTWEDESCCRGFVASFPKMSPVLKNRADLAQAGGCF
jgi:hypothetical protein